MINIKVLFCIYGFAMMQSPSVKQKISESVDLNCSQVLQIITSSENKFNDLIGKIDTEPLMSKVKTDCSRYFCNKYYGLDSGRILVCNYRHVLFLTLLKRSDQTQANLEFANLEKMLDKCLVNFDKSESDAFLEKGSKRLKIKQVEYTRKGISFISKRYSIHYHLTM
jgi:hypothetical protein